MSDVATLPVLMLTASLSATPSNTASVYVIRNEGLTQQVPLKIERPARHPQATTGEYVAEQAADALEARFSPHFVKLSKLGTDRSLWVEGSEPPAAIAIALAASVLDTLYEVELEPSRLVASAEGGVAICFVSGDKYADIECFNTGSVLGVVSSGRDRPIAWTVGQSQSEVAFAANRIRRFLQDKETETHVPQRTAGGAWVPAA